MFNVGDIVIPKNPEVAIGRGIITLIHTFSHGSHYTEECSVFFEAQQTTLRLDHTAIILVAPNTLTITEIQQLKDQLALDLLALIEAYEKRTNTHIATIHAITHTFEGDGIIVNRITGIRLEVQL